MEIGERSGKVRVRMGKGGKYREVPLNVTVRRVLVEYLRLHLGGEWFFVNRTGGGQAIPAFGRTCGDALRPPGRAGGRYAPCVAPHVL